jgi:hypothetical protein
MACNPCILQVLFDGFISADQKKRAVENIPGHCFLHHSTIVLILAPLGHVCLQGNSIGVRGHSCTAIVMNTEAMALTDFLLPTNSCLATL